MNAISIGDACTDAAELISQADGLLITAGAGMGMDSGMPDFRGDNGFWKAYPALGALGKKFYELANPKAFHVMPELAWGFYGHRLNLYRETVPHAGFNMLMNITRQMPNGAFIFTSNVDGHFQKAGFDSGHVTECHGSIHWMQCLDRCGQAPWPADAFVPEVDIQTCALVSEFPLCPSCGGMARPNIMMFNDYDWISTGTDKRRARLDTWLARLAFPVVLELGAGTAIPTVRIFGEEVGCPLIRINPTESAVGLQRDISIPLSALAGITQISIRQPT